MVSTAHPTSSAAIDAAPPALDLSAAKPVPALPAAAALPVVAQAAADAAAPAAAPTQAHSLEKLMAHIESLKKSNHEMNSALTAIIDGN